MKSFLNRVANRKDAGGLVNKVVKVGPYSVNVEAKVGDGGYATIYRVRDTATNTAYALKHMQLRGDPDAVADCQTEIATMKRLRDHPSVLTLRAAAVLGTKGQEQEAFLLLDLCTDNLVDYMKQRNNMLSDGTVLQIFHSVCKGVAIMHQQEPPMIHRDLKAENVLLHNNGSWVLCDFGSTTSWSGVYQTTNDVMMGEEIIRKYTTPAYRAPEMWDLYGRETIGTTADMWALGVLLFFMAYGRLPFDGDAKLQILNGDYKVPVQPKRSPEVMDLVKGLLAPQPSKRLDIDAVLWRLERMASSPAAEAPTTSRTASPARPAFAFDELDETSAPTVHTNSRGFAPFVPVAETAVPATFVADFGDFGQAPSPSPASNFLADFTHAGGPKLSQPINNGPLGVSPSQGFAAFDAASQSPPAQQGFAAFGGASPHGGLSPSRGALQLGFADFDTLGRPFTSPPVIPLASSSPAKQDFGVLAQAPALTARPPAGPPALAGERAGDRQGLGGGPRPVEPVSHQTSSGGAFWATATAATVTSSPAHEAPPPQRTATLQKAGRNGVRECESSPDPDPLLGSTFDSGQQAAHPTAQATGHGGAVAVQSLRRQITQQQSQIEALTRALQQKEATIRQLQADNASQTATLRRLQSQPSSAALPSTPWPHQEGTWDAFDDGIPAALRRKGAGKVQQGSSMSKTQPLPPAAQDPVVTSAGSEVSYEEDDDMYAPLALGKVNVKGRHRRTTSEPTPIESWGLTADWPPS